MPLNFIDKLKHVVKINHSYLCVGLDSEIGKIPQRFRQSEDALFAFNRYIVEETSDLVCAYKPNLAFYECWGSQGYESLRRTIDIIPKHIPIILDGKRGDIGNTSRMYAQAAYDGFGGAAVTLSPYMGREVFEPFLEWEDRFIFGLGRTSNPSAAALQLLPVGLNEEPFYLSVIREMSNWGGADQIGFVVGATQNEELRQIRELYPDRLLLIPGIGAQGGDIDSVCQWGKRQADGLMIVNVSRAVIFPKEGESVRGQAEYYRHLLNKTTQS